MCCKRIPSVDPAAVELEAWRPVGAGPGTVRRADASVTPADLSREMETRAQAAYQQGHAAGEAAGAQRTAQRIEPAMVALGKVIQELAGLRRSFRAEAEEDTVMLAIAIARRVLHREIATDPQAILGLVIAAFQKLNSRETHRLRVSPSDAAVIQEHRGRLEMPQAVEIAADASLAPGSVIFETSRGEMDASVDTQLSEIERGLADIVKRRSR